MFPKEAPLFFPLDWYMLGTLQQSLRSRFPRDTRAFKADI